MIYYTGIGSRKLPWMIKHKLRVFGAAFAELGYTLRSGAANGADTLFERGCDAVGGRKEIYLPWEDFNDHESNLFYLSPEATEIAEEIYGPRWRRVNNTTHSFMTRNMYQVMGVDLDEPSTFVVCWTPDGCTTKADRQKETGGTGQAIAYADTLDIPIFNMFNKDDEANLFNFLKTIGDTNAK